MELTIGQKIIRTKDRAIRKIREKKVAFNDHRRVKAERCLNCNMPQHIDSISMRRKDI